MNIKHKWYVWSKKERMKIKGKKKKKKEVEKNERQESEEVAGKPRTKSQLVRENRREPSIILVKEAPYPLVLSRKENERYFARFLDIFKKLEIIIPFGKALQ